MRNSPSVRLVQIPSKYLLEGSTAQSKLITFLAELDHEADRRRALAAYSASSKGARMLPMVTYGMNLGSTSAGQTSRVQSNPSSSSSRTSADDGGAAVIMEMVKMNAVLAMQKGQAGSDVFFVQATEVDQIACKEYGGTLGTGQYCPFNLFGAACYLTSIAGHGQKYHGKGAFTVAKATDAKKRAAADVQKLTCKRPKYKA